MGEVANSVVERDMDSFVEEMIQCAVTALAAVESIERRGLKDSG
tara:strand:- start:243 stop:374 length:132 start_codon:yes stop_codon:yes gene_type:complete